MWAGCEVMMKYLLLLALIGVIWWSWKKRNQLPREDVTENRDRAPEKMVVCARCGVHLPESDALTEGGKTYCCEAHRATPGQSG